jgi:pSer/pThr/pTyr-binding forkhead associated (FHA) protein
MAQITIGRNAQSTIVVDAQYNTVSGNHATISYDGVAYILQDHSTNGTYVNGNRIHHASCQIRLGDHITLGTQYVLNMNEVTSLLGGGRATHRKVNTSATTPFTPPVQPVNNAPVHEEKQESVRQPMPNSYMGLAIVSLILGISFPICWIISIVAIVNAGKVSTLWSNKEYSAAREASHKTKTLSWISIILGFVFVILYVTAVMSV